MPVRAQTAPTGTVLPAGTVLFERTTPPTDPNAPADQSAAPSPTSPIAAQPAADLLSITDAERSALTVTVYNLDVHLSPATAGIAAHAALTLRNDGTAPLTRMVLQITSTTHWDSFSTAGVPLKFVTRTIDTDADHTGQAQEAVVTLPKPLAPGSSVAITALYSGTIPASAQRLERIGAPADQAHAADWDAIAGSTPDATGGGTALRGFGNVLWYPVAAPPLFLGDGAKLFEAVGKTKLRESTATVSLRLAMEYAGDPPDAAFFCGRRLPFTAISDDANLPATESPGIATAFFDPQPLGFRTLDLFVTAHPATATGSHANPNLIQAVTDHYDALPNYAAAAEQVQPLLSEWFDKTPYQELTILDHPGQPFEDDALLVQPMRAADPASLAPSLVHSLTHAWMRPSSHPWIDEGLAQFMSLLWTERTESRTAALTALQDAAHTLALAEPDVPADTTSSLASNSSAASSSSAESGPVASPSSSPEGTSLISASGELFYRTKAAAVWWMLRGIVGDDALQQALHAYAADVNLDADSEGLEHAVEKTSHKDLRWFFNDWVYRDRGLPDLSIESVTPSQLDTHNGIPAGWLVAVVVRNDGYAIADVPVTVRSGTATETMRLRVPARGTASTRVVFAGTPQQVQVNDGSTPESRTSIHTRDLILPGHQ